MYVTLSDELRGLSGDAFGRLAFSFDLILNAHYRRVLLLCLTHSDVIRLQEIDLGPVARVSLATIRRRAADYQAALGRAGRVFQLCSDSALPGSFRMEGENLVSVRIREFARWRTPYQPKLFVENVKSDFRVVELIFTALCEAAELPRSLVYFVPSQGGGSTLSQVLERLSPGEMMGVCVTDRDCHPFDEGKPFCSGGTADRAYATAVAMNAIERGEFGLSSREPFFAFRLTAGRTIEGYIGPHLFDGFLKFSGASGPLYGELLEAFPNFPRLTEAEMVLWFSNNWKQAAVSLAELQEASEMAGYHYSPAQISEVAKLRFPRNTIDWLHSNIETGTYKRDLNVAFRLDLESELYAGAAGQLFSNVWDLLSADVRMATA